MTSAPESPPRVAEPYAECNMTKATKACSRIALLMIDIASKKANHKEPNHQGNSDADSNKFTLEKFSQLKRLKHIAPGSTTPNNRAVGDISSRTSRSIDSQKRQKNNGIGSSTPAKVLVSTSGRQNANAKNGDNEFKVLVTEVSLQKCTPARWNSRLECFICQRQTAFSMTCVKCSIDTGHMVMLCNNHACWVLWHNVTDPSVLQKHLNGKKPVLQDIKAIVDALRALNKNSKKRKGNNETRKQLNMDDGEDSSQASTAQHSARTPTGSSSTQRTGTNNSPRTTRSNSSVTKRRRTDDDDSNGSSQKRQKNARSRATRARN